ncbi:endonuclease V [Candidatus Halobonum tyrrellensis]|uniref:Endonuclease V n=1 Tax=Candidatus Halobonum tyrrellensis G22 TaxID=1324957 RepID=V4HGS7_9EURY|nr:endonuclease V [Candidatus Halobonum tyrrellensis]ESP89900.1 endonuclease V [Candidatus Halobonum tyrrellensis G22]
MPEPAHPAFVPDPELDRGEMEALQRRIAADAVFDDDLPFDPAAVTLADDPPADAPLVAGVDQAFLDDRAVSAVVVTRGDRVVERTYAVSPLSIPYVPGLLSFREGGPILDALAALESDPDLYVFDGSGRIHYRQAGLATHMGATLDAPAVGVAKSLLCGTPREDVDGRPAGWRTPVEADGRVEPRPGTAEERNGVAGTVIGHAYQSRQYDSRPVINPLYVSPGHRVSAATTVRLVGALCGGYKLPEPTRRADAYADEAKAAVRGTETEHDSGAGEGADGDD